MTTKPSVGRETPPILEFDPTPDAVIQPRHVLSRLEHAPEHAVLCMFGEVIERLERDGAPVLWKLSAAHGVHPVYGITVGERPVAVFHPGVGAPLAGAFLEEAISAGCRSFVGIGMAGALVPDVLIGHVVVPTAAIRDEGTSYHYVPAAREAAPAPEATRAIEEALARRGLPYVTGTTWTTDAPYRETRQKVERRVAEGCLTVEMEASALFSIAAFRGVPIGMILLTSDSLAGEEWDKSGFGANIETREALLEVAAEAVLTL
jgi:uridine phosphorylase